MTPGYLSLELRRGKGKHLKQRRGIVCLSMAAASSMATVAAYQMGIIQRLPEPPLPPFDSKKVDTADEAYAHLATPDALLGLGSYALTAILAGADGEDRVRRRPWLPLLMAGKVAFDAAQAARLTWRQWAKHRAFCIFCLGAAAATFAMVPLAFAEAGQALRNLTGKASRRAAIPSRRALWNK
jgi:hypothetical protein